ncbi:MAG: trehalose-6-phosphate synthase [Candidatus Thermoplasmatota archaeon]|nr:trehalose-6-phosphate synthase [Candidatus Thermoplasmatota archaeon]
MTYLVVTSRCPVTHENTGGRDIVKNNVGGVATALRQVMKQEGGIWVCWGDGNLDHEYLKEDFEGYKIVRIPLTQKERRGFYEDYSNGTLWPLFHYFRERIKQTPNGFGVYQEVNRKFAEKIRECIEPGTIIWIHDYQLALVPKLLKDSGIRNLIIFTWHIPWVAREFFSILPNAAEIADGIANADIITFHTELYKKNFRESCENLLGVERNLDDKLFSYSLGIDDEYFRKAHAKPLGIDLRKEQKLIFSLDRLDYTKGLVNRALAIESLLKMFPDDIRKFVYVMIVTPSRTSVPEYADMKKQLEMTVGRINGAYSDLSWQPIIYLYRKISDSQLMSYYRTADIALITPLIDGLNLVSKEFVAASDHGILILSEFAGSIFNLPHALRANPNDVEGTASIIHKAMHMEKDEIMLRLGSMKNSVSRRNLKWWLSKITEIAERKHMEMKISHDSRTDTE